MDAGVTVRALRARRGGRDVLRIDRLDVAAGERLGVLGPNGAGKTTLLRLIAGLDQPHAGEVRVGGVESRDRGVERRRRVGYVAERPALMTMSIRANVELPLRYRGADRRTRRSAAERALERLGIAHLAERPAHAVSRGEAQRTSLARALVCEPPLLLLDEPAAALDADARKAFLADLDAALAGRTTTVVHVSHRPADLLGFADRIAVLAGGALRQVSPPDELTRRPADALVARLVGFENVVPIAIGDRGAIELAGRATGTSARDLGSPGHGSGGGARLAAWAAGIELLPPGARPLEATVTGVSPGPGRWDVVLDAGATIRAHHPLAAGPPAPGERVALGLRPGLATIVPPGPEEDSPGPA
ncbi:MAG TPA: ABC transporter ATP-binding protein [Solirubrobacterales bacterium]|nr:ABC transporter ATP-binding protein [Solirubrobacterales bacterium]